MSDNLKKLLCFSHLYMEAIFPLYHHTPMQKHTLTSIYLFLSHYALVNLWKTKTKTFCLTSIFVLILVWPNQLENQLKFNRLYLKIKQISKMLNLNIKFRLIKNNGKETQEIANHGQKSELMTRLIIKLTRDFFVLVLLSSFLLFNCNMKKK